MLAPPHARHHPPSSTSLDHSPSSIIPHLVNCLQELGNITLADKVARCCTTFRVLTCPNGHSYQPSPTSAAGSGSAEIAPAGVSNAP
jgi:hypothetical protein